MSSGGLSCTERGPREEIGSMSFIKVGKLMSNDGVPADDVLRSSQSAYDAPGLEASEALQGYSGCGTRDGDLCNSALSSPRGCAGDDAPRSLLSLSSDGSHQGEQPGMAETSWHEAEAENSPSPQHSTTSSLPGSWLDDLATSVQSLEQDPQGDPLPPGTGAPRAAPTTGSDVCPGLDRSACGGDAPCPAPALCMCALPKMLASLSRGLVRRALDVCQDAKQRISKAVDDTPQAPVRLWLARMLGCLVLGMVLGGGLVLAAVASRGRTTAGAWDSPGKDRPGSSTECPPGSGPCTGERARAGPWSYTASQTGREMWEELKELLAADFNGRGGSRAPGSSSRTYDSYGPTLEDLLRDTGSSAGGGGKFSKRPGGGSEAACSDAAGWQCEGRGSAASECGEPGAQCHQTGPAPGPGAGEPSGRHATQPCRPGWLC